MIGYDLQIQHQNSWYSPVRDGDWSVATPHPSQSSSLFSAEELPPSLAHGSSSSPTLDSPKGFPSASNDLSQRHTQLLGLNSSPMFKNAMPNHQLGAGINFLSSSPPDTASLRSSRALAMECSRASHSSSKADSLPDFLYEPFQEGSHSAAASRKTRASPSNRRSLSAAPTLSSTPEPTLNSMPTASTAPFVPLSSDFSDALSRRRSAPGRFGDGHPSPQTGKIAKKPRTSTQEFSLSGAAFQIVIDAHGCAKLQGPESRAVSPMSRNEIDNILDADSDSDNESDYGSSELATSNDAISAFARSLARSRVGKLKESRSQTSFSVDQAPLRRHQAQSSYDPSLSDFVDRIADPSTPTSAGSVCMRVSRLMHSNSSTPPGAVLGYDAVTGMYGTGMTPYFSLS